MGDPAVYFGDDFGQKIDLTVRIREILRNYPEGTSIFKEMVQNADDAGATEVNFCLDYRQHASERLAYKKLELFQGPALLVHNNAQFSEADFQSIQRIGDSLKKDNSKGWKTGRFGVGFNSVYHMTDLPAFVSGSQLVFFDPQACHLPNVNPSNPGKMIDFLSHSDLVENFSDQVMPFQWLGCDFKHEFPGTIFRLALRTEEQAQNSRLSSRIQAPDHVAHMLSEFADGLHLVLLFLRNVSKISIYEWRNGLDEPTKLNEAAISNVNSDVINKRTLKHTSMNDTNSAHGSFLSKGIECDYVVEIEKRNCREDTMENLMYLMANQLGGGSCAAMANDPQNASQRLVPWGGVAVPIHQQALRETDDAVNGLAFCFLPLPTHTYLPIHVNGYFELSSNRRDIWFGDGLSGDGHMRAQWNISLLRDVIAPCYARAVLQLTNGELVKPEHHVQLLPQALPPAPWDDLAMAFFSLIRAEPCLFSVAKGGTWVTLEQSLIIKRDITNYEDLARWLLKDDFPIVTNLSEDLERVLIKTKSIPSYLHPQTVRNEYKIRHSLHAGNKEAIRGLTDFMLKDLTPSDLVQLVDVQFLPIANGSLCTFRGPSQVDVSSLEYLCSMGFSRQHSIFALETVGGQNVETALNWLFQNPNPSVVHGNSSIGSGSAVFFIPTSDEFTLLKKASACLVDIDVLTARSLDLLSSAQAVHQLNVKRLDYQGFEDLLSAVFPADWYGKMTVPWDLESDAEPDEEWFRLLWTYVGKSDHLSNFQDKWPIVPTSSGVLALLSATSGVLSPELISAGCLKCLQHLGVRLLLPNFFAGFHPHQDVWLYIQQPTPAGALTCLAVALESTINKSSDEIKRDFQAAVYSEREYLRQFLMSGMLEDLNSSHKHLLLELPIFHGFCAVSNVKDVDMRWIDDDESGFEEHSGYAPVFVSLSFHDVRTASLLMCVGIHHKFLDDRFIYVAEGDNYLRRLLNALGVGEISKVEFFATYFIPRFSLFNLKARIEFASAFLHEITVLLSEDTDGILGNILESAQIFPSCNGELKCINDLYDPEIEEFTEMMDASFFPALELQEPLPLSVLRSIGLQRALTRRAILALAVSLETHQTRLLSGDVGADKTKSAEELRKRAVNFFKYVDAHMEQLMTVSTSQKQKRSKKTIKAKGIKFLRTFLRDDTSGNTRADTEASEVATQRALELEQESLERLEIDDFTAKLAIIEWIPVSVKKPHSVAPWYRSEEMIVVASPHMCRPSEYLWLCSAQYHMIDGAYSTTMRNAFGWNKTLLVEVIASQLKHIAVNFELYTNEGTRIDDTQVVWSAVYQIYQRLSRFFETEYDGEKRQQVLEVLAGNLKCVWVGNQFVGSNQVAISSYLMAEPYLYVVPSELLHFRPFLKAIGVRERFTLADYVYALKLMYLKYQPPLSDDSTEALVPLSSDELTISIGLIQSISDVLPHHSDFELFAPDTNGILVYSVKLTYDDAPWLDRRDHQASFGPLRFIHSKLSNEVASKIGAKSLRGQLLHANSPETMVFGNEGDVEAFGQTEALTKRISHILEQYPDGPNIINELIQNADDAGASRVCVMYSGKSFGASSVLSPAMAKWQGPALYCYNDAEFKDSDFINLARIGQGNKLQHAATTGRFGLGFNSVYHFTDLPSIVSAQSIVMFDPHASHLPGITPANPGIKIRFVNSGLVDQFPDQFAPFKNVFGCDLKNHFSGTMFRFPLRDEALSAASEIKRRAYSQREIIDLFQSFKAVISSTMLFLRNVQKVEVYFQGTTDNEPVLLYGAEVPSEDRGESWRQIDRFVSNNDSHSDRMSSKRAFYSRLARTRDQDLPSVTQILHIRSFAVPDIDELFLRLRNSPTDIESNDTDNTQQIVSDEVEKYLICNHLGGGRAREIACALENESLKLIPWVGVASRIDNVQTTGRAFCFLPLPVRVGLPVHINGYFELSSNRRDIWHGDDMTGDGKLRSEWNASLLSDAVAPAYLTFLLEAKRICGDNTSKYLSLFPTKLPEGPWISVVQHLFRIMKDVPVFDASPLTLDHLTAPIRSVFPSACVLVDEHVDRWEMLERCIWKAGLNTVHLPEALHRLLVETDAVYGSTTPSFFRDMVRSETFLPSLDKEMVTRAIEFCLSDFGRNSMLLLSEIDNLPILPLNDGTFGRLRVNTENQNTSENLSTIFYFGHELEVELLQIFPNRMISRDLKQFFDSVTSIYEISNIRILNIATIVDHFFPQMWSTKWMNHDASEDNILVWEPAARGSPSQTWMRQWWKYMESHLVEASSYETLPLNLSKWCLIPISCSVDSPRLACHQSATCLMISRADSGPSMDMGRIHDVLAKIGIFVIDSSYIYGENTLKWMLNKNYAHKLDSDGVLAAVSRYRLTHGTPNVEQMFAEASEDEKELLFQLFVLNGFENVQNHHVSMLQELPIFPVYLGFDARELSTAEISGNVKTHVPFYQGRFIPDADADTRILDENFFFVKNETDRKFLRSCGVEELSFTKILLDHVFPRLSTIAAYDASLADSVVINALITLPFHQRNEGRFRAFVTKSRIIPSRKRVLRAIHELHDPNSKELSDLVGENSLPALTFSSPEVVDILRSLGLRTSLSCHAIFESARSVEMMYDKGEELTAWMKSHSLLAIVNQHFDQMSEAVSGNVDFLVDTTESESITSIMAAMKDIRWLPARETASHPLMPWIEQSNSVEPKKLLTSAIDTRPEADAWWCSYCKHILDGQLLSQNLYAAFGWNKSIDPIIIATQLETIGLQWEHRNRMSIVDSPSSLQFKHLLNQVQQMYDMIETARVENGGNALFDSICDKLSNAPWIWTGSCFARPQQIALLCDSDLEPILHSAPSELIIARSLLEAFNVKTKFESVDYLVALKNLPRNTILGDGLVQTCLKLYSFLADDLSSLDSVIPQFAQEGLVLLDDQNRLVSAILLTYDDMDWDTSSEFRRGCRFASKSIPREIAVKLGASSLHFRLGETSLSSSKVLCPSVTSLQHILPNSKEWYHVFFSEVMLAVERLGGTQVDFFVDYRHHASQRVIQPSLQTLQDEAICVHVHGMVLTADDVNGLYGGESSRAGFLAGFFFSDCMQILSGDGFYVLDPSGSYLTVAEAPSPPTLFPSQAPKEAARRYDILSEDFLRYPDQLLPFCTLPSCPGNVARGTQSTLIRFPWRKTESILSAYTLKVKQAERLVTFIQDRLYDTLVFTESVYRVSVWSVGKSSEFVKDCHGEASLNSPESTLKLRNSTRLNLEWRKKFSFQSFFKSPVTPENQMEFSISLEINNAHYRDTWLFSDNIGAGRSRDLVSSAVHEALNSTPYVSVACHLFRDGHTPPKLRGRLFKIVDTCQQVGLPLHINGCFKKNMKEKQLAISANGVNGDAFNGTSGSEAQLKAHWNRVLIEDGVVDAYLKLLLVAKRRHEATNPKALYRVWPALVSGYKDSLGRLIHSQIYRVIGNYELFLCTDGNFRSLNSGYLIDHRGMDILVASFAQLHFPAFNIQQRILSDCSQMLPSRVSNVTPKVMRRFLRNMGALDIHATTCLSLLEYCLSDVQFPLPAETNSLWSELHGLPLLPLEDGSIGVIRVGQRNSQYVLATFNQIQLLPNLAKMFVSLQARQRLHKFFADSRFTSVLGLSFFSIKTLSDHVDKILPRAWKNQASVVWQPENDSEIDRLWIYRFWQEVRYERRSLGYFSSWPLIPVKGSRLMSCGKPDAALCMWGSSGDEELSDLMSNQFRVAIEHHEEKLAEMERERRQLLEIAENKLRNDSFTEDAETEDAQNRPSSIVGDSDHEEVKNDSEDDAQSHDLTEDGEITVEFTDTAMQEDDGLANVVSLEDLTASIGEELFPAEVALQQEVANTMAIDHIQEEFCSRERIHTVLLELNIAMLELAYFRGQENEMVPQSRDATIACLDSICASNWNDVKWRDLSEDNATLLAEYFSYHGEYYGGFNRMHIEMLKKLPIYVNISGAACAVNGGDFYLIPPEINLGMIPLPPNARERFLKINPRLTAFYKELGVQEMSDAKLLLYVLPMYEGLPSDQCDMILTWIKQKWQTLRGDAELTGVLRTIKLFRDDNGAYQTAHSYFDPRINVLAAIYHDQQDRFPLENFRSNDWLDLMGEIGLQTDVTVDVFIECAQRIEDLCANKQALTTADETLAITLHQFLIQNFEKYDRSRPFFESISQIAFVPAIVYERASSNSSDGSFNSRSIMIKYSQCAAPDDQSLVFSTKPIIISSALPPRVLWSRLGLVSPPEKEWVLLHLHKITNDEQGLPSTRNWQFFLPKVDVFQEIFKYLQNQWDELSSQQRKQLEDSPIIPVGSSLVKGSRLFFHLTEKLAPLMFEVPRAFGAYDALFRHLGSKESPEVQDYVRILRDLYLECRGEPLNLNELIAVVRIVSVLASTLADSNQALSVEAKKSIYLPSSSSVLQPILQMAYNDAPWLCARINLTDLHIVHPRVSTKCCHILGVPGISTTVKEELNRDGLQASGPSDDVAHFNTVLMSQQFGNGLRRIITAQQQKATPSDAFNFTPDFDLLNQRIASLASFQVKSMDSLKSSFIATLQHPLRRIDVTKDSTATTSLSFIDQANHSIYIAKRTLDALPGMRLSQVVATAINQLLGGILQDCSAVESILLCDIMEIPTLLQLMHISEDQTLIVEKLRGMLGEILSETDQACVELSPLRSCSPGEIVAVELDGSLRYGKIVREQEAENSSGISSYEIKISNAETKWYPATQVYTFQSARVNSRVSTKAGGSNVAALTELLSNATQSTAATSELPHSVQTLQGNERVQHDNVPIAATTVVTAVNDLLSRLNLSLNTSFEDLLAENLRLQHRLEQAEEGRRVASAQIETAIREKKEAQDSLVCAICLENNVDCVLIPCGHIYCNECVSRLPRPSCPICRHAISSTSVFHVPS